MFVCVLNKVPILQYMFNFMGYNDPGWYIKVTATTNTSSNYAGEVYLWIEVDSFHIPGILRTDLDV